jgi:hypothetical protein
MNREAFGPNVLGPVYESTPPPDESQGSKTGRGGDLPPATPPKPGQA